MSNQKIVPKLSPKAIVGDVKKLAKDLEAGQEKDLCTIYGVVTGTKTGEGDNGPWVAFLGQFKGVNHSTGEEVLSGKAFLPDVAGALVEAIVADAESSVEFAFVIGIKESASSVTGYEYYAKSLQAPSQDDALSRLEASLKNLPKPKKVTE